MGRLGAVSQVGKAWWDEPGGAGPVAEPLVGDACPSSPPIPSAVPGHLTYRPLSRSLRASPKASSNIPLSIVGSSSPNG